jgi:hypothetical protein
VGWVFNVTLRPLYPRERPGTHCIGGWVGLRAGLDGKSRPHQDSIPGPSSPVASRYTDWAIAIPKIPIETSDKFLVPFIDLTFFTISVKMCKIFPYFIGSLWLFHSLARIANTCVLFTWRHNSIKANYSDSTVMSIKYIKQQPTNENINKRDKNKKLHQVTKCECC